MAATKKIYSRHFIVRASRTLWRGDPAEAGSPWREFVITSDEFGPSTQGTFQVYCLQASSGGIKDGRFVASDKEPTVLFDKDFGGLSPAAKQFHNLITEAQEAGFQPVTNMELLELEDKLRRSQ